MMKQRDLWKLIKNESQYGKTEWLLSFVMQSVLLACVFVVISFFVRVNHIGDLVIHEVFDRQSFTFDLRGYTADDREALRDMGFHSFWIGEDRMTGDLDCLDHIWWIKIRSVMNGKDVWNETIDNYLMIMLFCRIAFAVVAILLWVILLNSISNSFQMKLKDRERFIKMLDQLGCARNSVFGIYFGLFAVRSAIIFVAASLFSGTAMFGINAYIKRVLGVETGMPVFSPMLFSLLMLIHLGLMLRSLRKAWRASHEES